MKIYLMIGAAVAALGLLTYSHVKAYKAGRAAEQAAFAERINEENENAGNNAEEWRAELRRCTLSGGVFNFETGSCE